MQKTITDPLINYQNITQHIQHEKEIHPITMIDVRETLNNIKTSNSTGIDLISIKTIKNIQKTIEHLLLKIVNLSITQINYPKSLKCSKVIPLLKADKDPTQPLSYRGINLISSIGKIIDRVVTKQLLNHLVENNTIPFQHHGALSQKSTITALMQSLDEWTENLDNKIDKQ